MNTRLSGSTRIDDIQSHPQGDLRAQTKVVKITEDVRKYAAEQGIADTEALERGMTQKSEKVVEKGAEVYARAG